MESEGSERQNAGPTNRKRIEAVMPGEEAIISKAQNLSGSMNVDATGISRKVSAQYPGRSARQEWAEVSRGHSSCRETMKG